MRLDDVPPGARATARGAPPTTAQQGMIRLALLVGVLLFGAVAWWLTRDGRIPIAGPDGRPTGGVLRVVAAALAVGAVGVAAAMRAIIARTADPARVAQLRILAWALAELPALLGGVYWLMSGDASRYVIGLVAMLAAFVVVPLRTR